MYTRREFTRLTLAGLAAPVAARGAGLDAPLAARHAAADIGGVRVGVQTYSFRDLPRPQGGDAVDVVIRAITDCGLTDCELWAPQVEPRLPRPARDELRAWRLATPLDHFRSIGRKFRDAGVSIHAYNFSFNADMTDAELDRGFEMTKALGAQYITASTTLQVARRVAPFAERHQMVVAMHGHSNTTDPNEFATPASFAAAMQLSKYFKVNLDIGHFTAANFDAVAYLREHHANITNLHIKDRRRNQGDNVPWGQGDTPIAEVLRMLKTERWPISADIEYEHRGAGSPIDEVAKCMQFARQALA
jgi:sugar phosphate isomerase/epimerase